VCQYFPTSSQSEPILNRQMPLGVPIKQLHLEPRCRLCRNDNLRSKVNDLLTKGSSYAMIVRALEGDNAVLDKHHRVTLDSVRNHCARHFPVQNVAQATYREIAERGAAENAVDFVNGITTALTPMPFLGTVMLRVFQTLRLDRDRLTGTSATIHHMEDHGRKQ
jgi:hypothetical protein